MDKDIIWIIIAVATGILSMVGKPKKKPSTRNPTSVPTDTSAWDDIFESKPSSPAASTTYDSPYIYETDAVVKEKMEANSAVSEPKARATFNNSAYDIIQIRETELVSNDIDDFTLRKAIIYSEILKPKFTEY